MNAAPYNDIRKDFVLPTLLQQIEEVPVHKAKTKPDRSEVLVSCLV